MQDREQHFFLKSSLRCSPSIHLLRAVQSAMPKAIRIITLCIQHALLQQLAPLSSVNECRLTVFQAAGTLHIISQNILQLHLVVTCHKFALYSKTSHGTFQVKYNDQPSKYQPGFVLLSTCLYYRAETYLHLRSKINLQPKLFIEGAIPFMGPQHCSAASDTVLIPGNCLWRRLQLANIVSFQPPPQRYNPNKSGPIIIENLDLLICNKQSACHCRHRASPCSPPV